MYVHIGKDKMINGKDIVMILDYQKIKNISVSQNFLKNAHEKGLVEKIFIQDEKDFKSVIITSKKLYYSPIAASTLLKRTLE